MRNRAVKPKRSHRMGRQIFQTFNMPSPTLCLLVALCLPFVAIADDNHLCDKIETFEEHDWQIVMRDHSFTYTGWCNYYTRRCTKTSTVARPSYQYVPISRTRRVQVCCEGYATTQFGDRCDPKCEQECAANSHCTDPGTCSCVAGFERDHLTGLCDPICEEVCANGNCAAPNVCECFDGYTRNEHNMCVPACTNCSNGLCTAPETCSCYEGYSWVNSTCKRICTNTLDYLLMPDCIRLCENCENGKCIGPETCSCDNGYIWNNASERCSPVCHSECENGKCVGPDSCSCDNGYNWNNASRRCSPVCQSGCENGKCIGPDTCSCDTGYIWNNASVRCSPVCQSDCEHGKCIAPDTCSCDNRFSWNNASARCSPVCPSGCLNGVCTAPETCACNSGYEKSENSTECKPTCKQNCFLAKCISVDTCECLEGHHFVEDSVAICEPHCMIPCSTQICKTSPFVCDEKPTITTTETEELVTQPYVPDVHIDCGHTVCSLKNCGSDESPECLCPTNHRTVNATHCAPVCKSACINAVCSQPDVCQCNAGYGRNSSDTIDSHICQPWCGETNLCSMGTCVAPNECQCHEGYRPSDSDPFGCVVDIESTQSSLEKNPTNHSKMTLVLLVGLLALICVGVLGLIVLRVVRRRAIAYPTNEPTYIYDSENDSTNP